MWVVSASLCALVGLPAGAAAQTERPSPALLLDRLSRMQADDTGATARRAVFGPAETSPAAASPFGPRFPWSPSVTEAVVAPSPPIPAGQSDNYNYNETLEPTIARDPVNGRYLASSYDFREYAQVVYAGVAGAYTSADGLHWSLPSYPAGTTPGCDFASDILPGYCDLGLGALGDVTMSYGPKADRHGHFSYRDGARAYDATMVFSIQDYLAGGSNLGVSVSRSDDDGASWSSPATVAPVTADYRLLQNDKPVSWADGNPDSPCFGSVYASWTQIHPPDAQGFKRTQVAARSTDGGSTFSAPYVVTGNPFGMYAGGIRTLPDGTVVLMYTRRGPSDPTTGYRSGTVEVARSHDCGQTYDALVTGASLNQSLNQNVPGTYDRVASIPSIDVAGDNVYATWSERDPASGVLFVRAARSEDGGAHWDAPVTISDPNAGSAFMPAIGSAHHIVYVSYANIPTSSLTPGPGVASFDMLYAIANRALERISLHRLTSRSADPDANGGFMGDYTSIITTGHGRFAEAHPIWTDGRYAVTCPQYDAWQAGQAPTYPDVNHVCPANFGRQEIWTAKIDPRGADTAGIDH